MHELHELKEMLCEELKEYGRKGSVSRSDLEIIDALAHAAKNVEKLIEADEESEYSGRYMPRYYAGGGRSYARKRDGMGRYSRDGMADKLRELLADAPDEKSRDEIRRLADKRESM